MQRFAWKSIAIAVLACGVMACANEGVGDPCIPESIPCTGNNGTNCGFKKAESYVESSSVQCRSRVCIVHKLDSSNSDLADPRKACSNPPNPAMDHPNCVTGAEIDQSVYCTCRCKDGDGKKIEGCECSDGFTCQEILKLGGDGVRGSYCVRPDAN